MMLAVVEVIRLSQDTHTLSQKPVLQSLGPLRLTLLWLAMTYLTMLATPQNGW